jgi:hypothetical protein
MGMRLTAIHSLVPQTRWGRKHPRLGIDNLLDMPQRWRLVEWRRADSRREIGRLWAEDPSLAALLVRPGGERLAAVPLVRWFPAVANVPGGRLTKQFRYGARESSGQKC